MAAGERELEAAQAAMKARQERDRNKRRVETRRRNQEMQASATTLNITGPAGEEIAVPIWGHEPEPAIDNGLPEVETVTVPLSTLEALQAQINELKEVKQVSGMFGSREELAYFIQEMKKPDAETQAKLEAEKERKERERQDMINMALMEEQETKNRQANCPHLKPNRTTAYVVANEKDGMYMYLCQHCQKVTEPTRMRPEQFGVNVGGSMVFA